MKKILLLLILCTIALGNAFAQKISGVVYDAKTFETLPGVTVSYTHKGENKGTMSDENGYYELNNVESESVMLVVSYMGYKTETYPMVFSGKTEVKQDIHLEVESKLLDAVVVSAGRFEQKLSDITVSMVVLKPEEIKRQSPKDLRDVLVTVPGVDVTDKQPSIRGGSGWTYGVGSRSQILVDGISVLAPGKGEINWNTIPMENIAQIEIIKGASSVLYGSSALNGIIDIRTDRPGLTPKTDISTYVGIYGDAKNKGYQWSDANFWKEGKYPVTPLFREHLLTSIKTPIYTGIDFSHSRRIENFDVSGGVNIMTDEGYRKGDFNKRARIGGNLTYHDPNVRYLDYGFNVNYMANKSGDFFIWRSDKEAYDRSALTNMGREESFFTFSPFLNYKNDEKGYSHRLNTRFTFLENSIFKHNDDRNLLDIIRNMGVTGSALESLINNPGQAIAPIIPPLLTNDLPGTIDALIGVGNKYFPNASSADYSDMIAWLMNNGLPNGENYPEWAANVLSPKENVQRPDQTTSYYLDYKFAKKIYSATFTTGLTYEHVNVRSTTTDNHKSDNVAAFFQYDQKFFDRLNISAGARFEYYRVDSYYREAETKFWGMKMPFKPIFRGGLNYELAEHSFLRASFGQGYRYPSITEKFVLRNIGGVGAYPNEQLKAESGFNAEIGIKQGYKFGPFYGYFDMAAFYTRYRDMIEFNFGLIDPDPTQGYPFVTNLRDVGSMIMAGRMPAIGVKFDNVNRAEIYGVDVSFTGFCDISPKLKMIYSLGYVYSNPIDMDADKINAEEAANTDLLAMKSKSNTSKYLKYRQKHDIKGSFDFQWERFSIGTNFAWKSKTLAADYFILDERTSADGKYDIDIMDPVRKILFGDLDTYWKKHNKDYFVMDFRFGVNVTKQVSVQMTINNLLNKEYSTRPMNVAAPRTYLMKLNVTL